MTLEPLLVGPPAIAVHAAAAAVALILGVIQLAGVKGAALHRQLGWVWAAAMMIVAATSFWIHDLRQFGPFSWIHGLSVLVLLTVLLAVYAARRGRRETHRRAMLSLFVFALVITGGFTLLPGRVMHAVVFGG